MTEQERKDIIIYRITRANETLLEVEEIIKLKYWNTAVNRIYYSCFYSVIALLVSKQIPAQTHAGVRQMLGLHFIKTGKIKKEFGKFYSIIFDERLSGDYKDFIQYEEEEVLELFNTAKEFVKEIEKHIEY